ncbi:hypothetical protein KC19_VG167100, partial [Ceratodon purpureus]
VRKEISPIVLTVISSLVPILSNTEGLNKSLLENSAITLGRLGWVCPELVAPHMEHFMQPWCRALCTIRDGFEKEDAFRGLCAMVRLNPGGAVNSFVSICEAIGSWHVSTFDTFYSEVVHRLFANLMLSFTLFLQKSRSASIILVLSVFCQGTLVLNGSLRFFTFLALIDTGNS